MGAAEDGGHPLPHPPAAADEPVNAVDDAVDVRPFRPSVPHRAFGILGDHDRHRHRNPVLRHRLGWVEEAGGTGDTCGTSGYPSGDP